MSETLFKLSIPNLHQQYLHIEIHLNNISDETAIYLPTWRPGRYELGDFAKNIKAFKVFDENNKTVSFKKTSKHCWLIDSKKANTLRIQYQYYSSELNAGSTYVTNDLLYINPVNCLMYTLERMENQVQIELNPDMADGIYSNLAVINHSPSEFVLDFIRSVQRKILSIISKIVLKTLKTMKSI
jgi:predicted metalloprotease with PDZ domain